jgi:methylthioribulose-1-phosphate dehydratase
MNRRDKAFVAVAAELVEAARLFGGRGWALATSGNFSARVGERAVAITRSGCDKQQLLPDDLVLVNLDGGALDPPDARPSAEAAIHGQLYRRRVSVGAVLHVHSPAATVMSRLCEPEGAVVLSGWEMQKGLAGVLTHEQIVRIPIFGNTQDVASLAAVVGDHVTAHPEHPGCLIAGHGIYGWGASVTEARCHIEALEFLCECEWRLRAAAVPDGDRK